MDPVDNTVFPLCPRTQINFDPQLFSCLCLEPDNVRLVEGGSRCAGRLEIKLHEGWKPVDGLKGDLKWAALVCRQMKCGFVVSTEIKPSVVQSAWGIISSRVQTGSPLRERVSTRPWHSSSSLEIACSGNISHDGKVKLSRTMVLMASSDQDMIFKHLPQRTSFDFDDKSAPSTISLCLYRSTVSANDLRLSLHRWDPQILRLHHHLLH